MAELVLIGIALYIYINSNKNKSSSTAVINADGKTEQWTNIKDYPIGTIITPTVIYDNVPTTNTNSIAGWTWKELKQFAESQGFYVTSTVRNNSPNHKIGKAIDVRTKDKTNAQVNTFITLARSKGIIVYDERTNIFNNPLWSAPHLHLQVK